MKKHNVISIGREFGSGGRKIGFLLAEKLGVKCYDKELLSIAAKTSGMSEDLFETHDEKPTKSFLHTLVMDSYSMNYSANGFVELPMNHKIFLAQFETIKNIAKSESCVIVGRCADYALEENDYLTSIFIHAPLGKRIESVAKNQSIDEEKAKDLILKTDKKRSNYYNYYTNRKWGDANNYQLSFDSSTIGYEKSVDFIMDFLNKR